MPPQEFDDKYEQLKEDLPEELAQLAFEHGAFARARIVKSPDELLYTVFLYSVADLSCREIAGVCAGGGKEISDEAIRQRLLPCREWLEAILGKMLPKTSLPLRQEGWRLVICDGSQVSGPGSKGTDYRWHIGYDPVQQRVLELHFSDAHTSESLQLFSHGPGDLVLGDRQYARASALMATRLQGAHVVVRMTPSYLKVWTLEGEEFDLVAALRQVGEATPVSFALEVRDKKSGASISVWIHAHHLNQEQCNAARRRVKRKASRNSHTPKERTLFLSEWVLVLTTVPPQELSADVILELYRVRWQVELVIKRYKSLLDAAQVRAKKGSAVAEVYLLGKLLFAVLVERRAMNRLGNLWTQMTKKRTASWWRVWKLIAVQLQGVILNTAQWSQWDWRAVLRALSERKRRRRLQVIPAEVAEWLAKTPLAIAA